MVYNSIRLNNSSLEEEKTMTNFNELAYNAPRHGEKYGYIPSDDHYNEIIEWLKTGTKLYTEKVKQFDGTSSIVSRVRFNGSEYDAVVTYIPETKMIAYNFRRSNAFEV